MSLRKGIGFCQQSETIHFVLSNLIDSIDFDNH